MNLITINSIIMATSNFHNVNSSDIFAVELENEFDYDDLIENLKSEFNNQCKSWYEGNGNDPHESRSYPSKVLGSIAESIQYKEFGIECKLSVIVRSGYYSGCNLDWNMEYSLGGDAFELDDLAYNLRYQLDFSKSKSEKYALMASKKMTKIENSMVELTERIYGMYTDKIGVVARFSNGETIYSKLS